MLGDPWPHWRMSPSSVKQMVCLSAAATYEGNAALSSLPLPARLPIRQGTPGSPLRLQSLTSGKPSEGSDEGHGCPSSKPSSSFPRLALFRFRLPSHFLPSPPTPQAQSWQIVSIHWKFQSAALHSRKAKELNGGADSRAARGERTI